MRSQLKKLITLCAGLALLGGVSFAAAGPASASDNNGETKNIDGITVTAPVRDKAGLDAYLLSSEPKTVTIDVATGAIKSVTAGSPIKPLISYRSPCQSSDAQWAPNTPYAAACFYGSAGTYNGNWPGRNSFYTGQYTASAVYNYQGRNIGVPKAGPNTTTLQTATTTGVSATIY